MKYPTHQLTTLLSRVVELAHERQASAAGQDVLFSLNNEPVFGGDVANPSILLPLFVWQADRFHEYTTGRGMGVFYRDSDHSFLGKLVDVDCGVESNTELFLYVLEALMDMHQNCPRRPVTVQQRVVDSANIDALYHEFAQAMRLRSEGTGMTRSEMFPATPISTVNR